MQRVGKAEDVRLRPIIKSPEELAEAQKRMAEGLRGLWPPAILMMICVAFAVDISIQKQSWNSLFSATAPVTFLVTLYVFYRRAGNITSTVIEYAIAEKGLRCRITINGHRPLFWSTTEWNQFVGVSSEPDAVILHKFGDREVRIPNECFSSNEERDLLIKKGSFWAARRQ